MDHPSPFFPLFFFPPAVPFLTNRRHFRDLASQRAPKMIMLSNALHGRDLVEFPDGGGAFPSSPTCFGSRSKTA